eukprot:scaffold55103_cov13-Prasinocladus_malaysianus.AAC.1
MWQSSSYGEEADEEGESRVTTANAFLYIRLQTQNTAIIKIGITTCLRSRDRQYKDGGWFAHTFQFQTRGEARDAERTLVQEFASASVSTSG